MTKNKKRIDPRYFLNETTSNYRYVEALARGPLYNKIVTSLYLDKALENYMQGYSHGSGGKYSVGASAYDVQGASSGLGSKLTKQYQAALEEGKIGSGERGQRRFLDRLIGKHWEKLMQNPAKISSLARMGTWRDSVQEPTFADVIAVYEYHGGNIDEYKNKMRSALEGVLNRPPESVDQGRASAQMSTTMHGYTKGSPKHGQPLENI
tara:strand:+ start:36054 stop:36677 length:624 start_codon:yes stop_codon:yes gene_type:complete